MEAAVGPPRKEDGMMNALTLCNCCDVEEAAFDSRAGYCTSCEQAGRTGSNCWHDEA